MAIQQPRPIQQSKLANTNLQLATRIEELWSEARKLKANGGAKRLEHVCNHYDQLTPETTYRWIDPVGFQHEVEDSLAHEVTVWHIARNCVSVLPLILTWLALFFALKGFQQDNFREDAGKSFLQLWQEGFHGTTILTFSTTAAIDVGLLILFFILIWLTSSLDSHAYTRSTKFAQKLQAITEELMHVVTNTKNISVDKSAITNVANAVQQVVDDAMKANQQLIKDIMAASKQVTDAAEDSIRRLVQTSQDSIGDLIQQSKDAINQAVQQSQKSITDSNDRVESLFNRKITPLLDRFDTNVQALQGEIKNYQKRLDDLTDASQKLAGVSGQLAVNATAYKQVGQDINNNIAALNRTQDSLLQQIGAVSQGITGAAKDMNDAATNLGIATGEVKKVATQLDNGIQKTLTTMNNELKTTMDKMDTKVKATMDIMTSKVETATTTMSTRVQQTVDTMSTGVKTTAEEIRIQVDHAARSLEYVAPRLETAAQYLHEVTNKLSSISFLNIQVPGGGGSPPPKQGFFATIANKGLIGWLLGR